MNTTPFRRTLHRLFAAHEHCSGPQSSVRSDLGAGGCNSKPANKWRGPGQTRRCGGGARRGRWSHTGHVAASSLRPFSQPQNEKARATCTGRALCGSRLTDFRTESILHKFLRCVKPDGMILSAGPAARDSGSPRRPLRSPGPTARRPRAGTRPGTPRRAPEQGSPGSVSRWRPLDAA